MGRDFHENFAAARRVYEESSEALGLDLDDICFADPPRLRLTEFAQPAILATEIAMLRALEGETDLEVAAWGGHSLGEYTALVAAGALPLAAAVRIARARGRLMQEAVLNRGRMVALIGPAACGRCYEVSAELHDEVSAVLPQARSMTRQGTPALDLRAGIAAQLAAEGVTDVRHDDRCTIETPELFSYRRERTTGRFAGYIWMDGGGAS